MSRCYPYPPPGYQKKAQQPDLSIPPAKAVEKEKEKKGKDREKEKEKKGKDSEKEKDKKDKEKEKKDREKKDKDRDKDKEKKEKNKDKDKDKDKERRDKDKRDKGDKDKESKREKRKKDGETNGTSHGDKDPRSSKLQRTDVLHSTEENGRVREIKTTAAVVARPLDRDGKDAAKALDRDGKDASKALDRDGKGAAKPFERDGKDAAKPRGSVGGPATRPPSMYIKEQQQPNGKVDRTLPPIVLSKPVTGGTEQAVKVEEAAPSSRPSNDNHHIDSNNSGSHRPQRLPDFSVCDSLPERSSWSAIDDEDWLTPSSERTHLQPKAEVGEDTSKQVWSEALFLPDVDMYALPYVVPY